MALSRPLLSLARIDPEFPRRISIDDTEPPALSGERGKVRDGAALPDGRRICLTLLLDVSGAHDHSDGARYCVTGIGNGLLKLLIGQGSELARLMGEVLVNALRGERRSVTRVFW